MQAGKILNIQAIQEIYREKVLKGEENFRKLLRALGKWETQEKAFENYVLLKSYHVLFVKSLLQAGKITIFLSR